MVGTVFNDEQSRKQLSMLVVPLGTIGAFANDEQEEKQPVIIPLYVDGNIGVIDSDEQFWNVYDKLVALSIFICWFNEVQSAKHILISPCQPSVGTEINEVQYLKQALKLVQLLGILYTVVKAEQL